MFPTERSLVKRFEGQPFALLGVNSDPKARLRRVLKKDKITWRSWWDGGTSSGPIATQWNIGGWPSLYVLDHHGVLRSKSVRVDQLEEFIAQLVKEALAEE